MKVFEQILLSVGAGVAVGFAMAEAFTPANSVVETIPSASASDSAWITWCQDLANRFGQKNANAIFTNAFGVIKPTNVDTSAFRSYLASVGISYTGTTLDSIEDFTSGVFSSIGNGISDVFNAGKYITYIIVGGGVIALIMIIYSMVKHPEILTDVAKTAAIAA